MDRLVSFLLLRIVVSRNEKNSSVDDDISKPNHEMEESIVSKLRYYSKEIHKAAFILPPFTQQALYH